MSVPILDFSRTFGQVIYDVQFVLLRSRFKIKDQYCPLEVMISKGEIMIYKPQIIFGT